MVRLNEEFCGFPYEQKDKMRSLVRTRRCTDAPYVFLACLFLTVGEADGGSLALLGQTSCEMTVVHEMAVV